MESQIRQTVWCNVSDEAAGEIWNLSLLRVKGLMPTGLKKKTNWLSNENTTWRHSWRSCFKSNQECRSSKGERAWLIFRATADPTVETQNSIDKQSRLNINVDSEECLKIHQPSVWCRGRGCGPGMKYLTCRAHVVPRHIGLRAHHSSTLNLSRPCPNGSLSVVNLSFGQTCECAGTHPVVRVKKILMPIRTQIFFLREIQPRVDQLLRLEFPLSRQRICLNDHQKLGMTAALKAVSVSEGFGEALVSEVPIYKSGQRLCKRISRGEDVNANERRSGKWVLLWQLISHLITKEAKLEPIIISLPFAGLDLRVLADLLCCFVFSVHHPTCQQMSRALIFFMNQAVRNDTSWAPEKA